MAERYFKWFTIKRVWNIKFKAAQVDRFSIVYKIILFIQIHIFWIKITKIPIRATYFFSKIHMILFCVSYYNMRQKKKKKTKSVPSARKFYGYYYFILFVCVFTYFQPDYNQYFSLTWSIFDLSVYNIGNFFKFWIFVVAKTIHLQIC